MENSSELFATNQELDLGGDVFKGFSIFSSGGQFVQWSRTILAVLVAGHPRNIPEELF